MIETSLRKAVSYQLSAVSKSAENILLDGTAVAEACLLCLGIIPYGCRIGEQKTKSFRRVLADC
jgi:hypothetical protein